MFKYANPLLVNALLVSALSGCSPAGIGEVGTQSVSMCPEPFRMSDCRPGNSGPSCLFENPEDPEHPYAGTITRNPKAWAYDKDGVQLGNYPVLIADLLIGQKKRSDLVLGGAVFTAQHVVVCSMDPEDPLMANRLIEVKQ